MGVLITGGAGFIGSNVTRRLLDDGDEGVVIDALYTGFAANPEGLSWNSIGPASSPPCP